MASKRAFIPTLSVLRQCAAPLPATGLWLYSTATTTATRTAIRRPAIRRTLPIAGARKYSAPAESKIWSFEDVQNLTKDSQRKVAIVDVREPGELQSTGYIPSAINIPITSRPDSFHITEEDFEDRYGYPRPGKNEEVVFYCKAGVRSRAAAGLAKEAGWTKVGEYPGSWMDWAAKGGEVEK